MGPEGVPAQGAFSKDVPPAYDGHTSYAAYRQYVELWLNLASLERTRQGPALVGRLSVDPKAAAKSIGVTTICSSDGAIKILEHLDKSYGVDSVDQLDTDLADFLDFSWRRPMSSEEFIAGFHSRLDKLSELEMNDKLKGHLLLRQAGLDNSTRNVIVGAAGGNYDVSKISSALQPAFRDANRTSYNSSDNKSHGSRGRRGSRFCNQSGRNFGRSSNSDAHENQNNDRREQMNRGRSVFYSYDTAQADEIPGAIVDSGACTSVVGQETLNNAMKQLGLSSLPDANIKQLKLRFGTVRMK